MGRYPWAGAALAVIAYAAIGVGVGAAGTSLLVLLAKRVAPARRAAAATTVWLMMIGGFAVTATAAGHFLDPYSPLRVLAVMTTVSGAAFLLTILAVWNVEGAPLAAAPVRRAPPVPFGEAMRQVWEEPKVRRFAVFVFVSMLAYSAQEMILEPFMGAVFGLSPGDSTKITGMQHGGVLAGMLIVAIAGTVIGGARADSMRIWTIGGCIGSAAALLSLAAAGFIGPRWPLQPSVFALGIANGVFCVSAIGAMMGLAHRGREAREGVRMGLWGAAQAIAFALGGLVGTAASDIARHLLGSPIAAYAAVFALEALLFLAAAAQAARLFKPETTHMGLAMPDGVSGASAGGDLG
jgi:BCD family chlorophyll transporter-like MFS transporter